MKIIHVCRRFWPEQGGVETHVLRVAAEQIKRGHSVSVITLESPAELSSTNSEDLAVKIEILHIRANGNGLHYKLRVWRGVLSLINQFSKSDIIQVHDVFWWLLPIVPVIRHKLFITFHGYEPPGPPNWRQRAWHKLANIICVKSLGIGSFHEKWYGVQTDLISFGATDSPEFSRVDHSNVNESLIRIMYLGRLSEDVGIMSYLEGLRIFVQHKKKGDRKTADITLDVMGSGDQALEAKLFVEKHNLPVTFKGSVPDASTLASKYDLIFASRHLAIIEMLSQRKRVVAHYNNEIKKDYLLNNTPFAKWITTFHSGSELAILLEQQLPAPPVESQTWAHRQTWKVMADLYESLWGTESI